MKNLYRSIKFYFVYRNTILKNRDILKNDFNVDIDWVNRLYTVINVPETEVEEPFNIRKADIEAMSKKYVDDYVKSMNKWYSQNSLRELIEIYEFRKISKYSYLMVTGYSMFKTNKVANVLMYFVLPVSIIISLLAYFL